MAADEVETAQSEGGPSTVANEAFEAGAVVGLDPDRGVEAEPTAVVPGEHVLRVVGFQETLAASRAALLMVARSAPRRETARPSNEAKLSSMNVPENPGANRVLEPFEELGCETGGLVEADAAHYRIVS